jgi:hypothetical protein
MYLDQHFELVEIRFFFAFLLDLVFVVFFLRGRIAKLQNFAANFLKNSKKKGIF